MGERQVPRSGQQILSYYEGIDEAGRLGRGGGLLEFARMQELIGRFVPAPPGVVLDVGGGPGRYACWLAELGYDVHFIDPVEKHVTQARQASEAQPQHPLASVMLGDARSLDHGEGSADAVLLMGPLYHLPARDDRLSALREARRVLKPGGLLIAKAINRFASLLDGLIMSYIDDSNFVPILRRDLEEGQHRSQSDDLSYFTTAFFHRPEELEAEVFEMGFDQLGLYAVQGPGLIATDLEGRMSEPAKRAQLLDLIRSVEQEKRCSACPRISWLSPRSDRGPQRSATEHRPSSIDATVCSIALLDMPRISPMRSAPGRVLKPGGLGDRSFQSSAIPWSAAEEERVQLPSLVSDPGREIQSKGWMAADSSRWGPLLATELTAGLTG